MRKLALLALLVPGLAFAQVRVTAGVHFDLPVVLPQMVVVEPGVQVVPECDHEVFFVNGFYWVRDDGRWYRSRSHRGGWMVAPMRVVPASIVRIPPGHYKHWNPGKGHWKDDRRGPPAHAYERGGWAHDNGGGHGGGDRGGWAHDNGGGHGGDRGGDWGRGGGKPGKGGKHKH